MSRASHLVGNALPASQQEIHVWTIGLNPSQPELQRFASLISAEERQRAAGFFFERDRRRFIAAHGGLRAILARYLRIHADDLRFETESGGKPRLAHAHGRFLHFNLSHSRDLALVAVTGGSEIGVDIEWVSDAVDVDQVAQLVFSEAEIVVLNRLEGQAKREAFFNGWTRKEAIVKAIGAGLGYPVRELTVSINPNELPRIIAAGSAGLAHERWTLQVPLHAEGYVAAIAHTGPRRSLRIFDWSTTG